jgi:uncharacterized BrkB/YihY/UPF0761 family membrane protein
MFDVRDRSSWWKKRLKSLLLMVVGGTLLFTGAVAIVAGPHIAAALGTQQTRRAWLAWPLAFILLVGLLWLIYYICPRTTRAA